MPPESKFEKIERGLIKYRKTGVIYVRQTFKREGIPPLFATTGETKIMIARAKQAKLIQEHLNHYLGGKLMDKRKGYSVGQVIDEMLEVVTPTKRQNTQYNHQIYLPELKKEWGTWDVARVNEPAFRRWLLEFKKRKQRKTFWDYTTYMNMVLRYAYNNRYTDRLVVFKNHDPIKTDSGRVLTQDEIERLFEVMNETTRDQFVLAYECFMRLREVLYLEWDRVNFEHKTIELRKEDVKTGSRTGKGRTFVMSEHAFERLTKRAELTSRGRFVFSSPKDPRQPIDDNKTAWARAKREAKIQGRARWHDLRHTGLTRALLEEDGNPLKISEYAGVSMRTIQRVYLHSSHKHTQSVAGTVQIMNRGVKGV